MAEFMGGVQGNRGESTRLGSKDSGCDCWVKSWQTRASLSIHKFEDKDIINLNVKNISGTNNLKSLNIEARDFENENIQINGVQLNKLMEAYKLFMLPEKIAK